MKARNTFAAESVKCLLNTTKCESVTQ